MMSCMGASGFHNPSTSALPLTIPNHTSPEPNNVENLISDLLQAVTSDDGPVCSNCEEGGAAAHKCRDCSEILCDPCVRAHQRVRITKEHTIVRFNRDVNSVFTNNGTVGRPPSLASNSPSGSAIESPPNFCDIHREPHRLYCDSCLSSVCKECALSEHRGHSLVYIQEAMESARATTLKLCTETRSAMSAIKEAIDHIQKIAENVEIHSHTAATDVKNYSHRCLATIEERKQELLSQIEFTKQVKNKNLANQKEYLSSALNKLTHMAETLNDALTSNNGIDMMITSEKAALHLKQLRAIRSDLAPCESDHIVFVPSDLHRNMNCFGYVSTGSLNPQMRGPKTPKELLMPSYLKPIPVEMKGEYSYVQLRDAGIGRPIHGLANAVVVKDSGGITSLVFGTEGEGDGQLCRPWGVCCDRQGHIIVADRSNNRIQIFRQDGTFIRKFGEQGTAVGQFDRPAGVSVDPMGRIVVADKDNHRIQIFTLEGTFVLTFGEKGCRNGQFNYPWDVAVNSVGNIVVSDTRNHRIQLFSNEGTFLRKYGFEGSAGMWKHFDSPRGVCFNPSGYVIVTDFNNHRLVIVDPGLAHAQFLGQEGSGFKQFLRPQGIVCDDEGRIIVADSRNHRIQVFEANGSFLWKCGHAGKNDGELDRPSGICLTSDGRIVVIDFGNNRVQIF